MNTYLVRYDSKRHKGWLDHAMIVADSLNSACTIAWDRFGQRFFSIELWAANNQGPKMEDN